MSVCLSLCFSSYPRGVAVTFLPGLSLSDAWTAAPPGAPERPLPSRERAPGTHVLPAHGHGLGHTENQLRHGFGSCGRRRCDRPAGSVAAERPRRALSQSTKAPAATACCAVRQSSGPGETPWNYRVLQHRFTDTPGASHALPVRQRRPSSPLEMFPCSCFSFTHF